MTIPYSRPTLWQDPYRAGRHPGQVEIYRKNDQNEARLDLVSGPLWPLGSGPRVPMGPGRECRCTV